MIGIDFCGLRESVSPNYLSRQPLSLCPPTEAMGNETVLESVQVFGRKVSFFLLDHSRSTLPFFWITLGGPLLAQKG